MVGTLSACLPYHEPDILTILTQSSFLFLLNVVNHVLDNLVYCGLLGQVFIGVAWGSPGAGLLGITVEQTIAQLGYLGLILLVYEGGLSTNLVSVKANLWLSVGIAVTGIGVPIALSFSLKKLASATTLQAFAGGAALCSTSLGTTFTILNTSGLTTSRLGVVLTSAAMMDDVVGLIMVQVITNLASAVSSFSAVTIVRPITVSLGMVFVILFACRFFIRHIMISINFWRKKNPKGMIDRALHRGDTTLLVHSIILFGLVTGASYAGASNLLAAYLAGASVSWWDAEVSHLSSGQADGFTENKDCSLQSKQTGQRQLGQGITDGGSAKLDTIEIATSHRPCHRLCLADEPSGRDDDQFTGLAIYKTYYLAAVERILKPFFFASIGFAVPISHMFSGSILWRGAVYALLMASGKMICALWLVRFTFRSSFGITPSKLTLRPKIWRRVTVKPSNINNQKPVCVEENPSEARSVASEFHCGSSLQKPLSLYPASIIGSAMIARGEIGFLISSLAESNGIFSSSRSSSSEGGSEIYLIVTWAILLCTILSPISVGLLVKRVRRLQRPGRNDLLGIWGVGVA
ncbi:Sodium/hydrogen exchanger family-domain-containing protein [Lipomyces chichibuensis]|uniref:Sodium/hydrogen exchanger family-domain-containing protein n=1 Tax=Lipomyces chichibuensis TaxID=1546026 RepID=UPI003343D7B6